MGRVDNPQIAHVNLFKIKKQDTNKNTSIELECNFYEIGTTTKIEDIFIPEPDNLIVVSKKQIMEVNISKAPTRLLVSSVFNVEKNLGSEGVVKDVQFSSEHGLFYVMVEENADMRIFCRFKIEDGVSSKMVSKKVSKAVSKFEIHKKHKNLMFLIVLKEIFQLDLDHKASPRDSVIVPKLRKGKSNNHNNINILKKKKKKTDVQGCSLYFFNGKNPFRAFKFDQTMKYFYTHDDNVFKKYLAESKTLIDSYFRHNSTLNQILFSDDYSTIFSIDVSDVINIWDAENGEIISSLNKGRKIYKIKDMKVISNGDRLVVRDQSGITMWNLRKGLKNFSLPMETDLAFSSFTMLEGGRYMMFDKGESELLKVEIGNDMRSEVVFRFPYEMYDYQTMGSGDLVVKSEKEYSDLPLKEREDLGFVEDYAYVFKLDYYDLNVYKEKVVKDHDDEALQNGETDNENESGNEENMIKAQEDQPNTKNAEPGKHFVFSCRNDISCYNAVSDKGMRFPKLYENGSIIRNSRYNLEYLKEDVKVQEEIEEEEVPHHDEDNLSQENNKSEQSERSLDLEFDEVENKILAGVELEPDLDVSQETAQKNTDGKSNSAPSENIPQVVQKIAPKIKKLVNISKTIVTLGTEFGDCTKVEFHLDSESNLIKKMCTPVFKGFHPLINEVIDKVMSGEMGAEPKKPNSESSKIENENIPFEGSNELLMNDSEQSQAENLDDFSPIQDYAYFSRDKVEAVLFSKGSGVFGHAKLQFLYVYMRHNDKQTWSVTNFSLNIMNELEEETFFKIKSMQIDVDIETSPSRPLRFFLVSTLGIAIIEYIREPGSVKLVRFLKKNMDPDNLPIYSPKQNSFYLSNKNAIQIWDGSLEYLVYSIDLDQIILGVTLVDNEDHEEYLLIYDETTYYEIELETLRLSKKIGFLGKSKQEVPCMPFNISSFPQCQRFIIPIFQEIVSHINFFTDVDTMNLNNFPFADLAQCFDKEDFADPIRRYAAYYFSRIKLSNFEDWFYGPLNPILFSIHHNSMALLEEILDNYRYPRTVGSYWSPLSFAFRYNYNSAVKVLCDKLVKRSYFIEFRRQDFKSLLRSSFSYAHRLLATVPWEPSLQNFPRLMYMKSQVGLRFENEVGRILYTIKRDERRIHKKRVFEVESEEHFEIERSSLKKKQQISKKEVLVFQVPFKYNFAAGSPDSILLLEAYSNSRSEEFVLSQWKELIRYKWKYSRWAHIVIAVLYWLFTLTVTLSIVFFPEIKFLMRVSVYFIFAFIVYELIQFISYATFNIGKYFKDLWNYLDWLCFGILLFYFFYYQHKTNHVLNQVLGTLGLIVMYYRSFSHLRVIDSFTTLIGMINVIIQKLLIFFAILIYFYATTTLLLIKLDPSKSKIKSIESAYVWTLFGGVETGDFETFNYGSIAIVFGTIVVTVILLNVLIAFLSNLFSRLEDQQRSNDLREKADMMLDLEVMMLFFRFKLTGKDHMLRHLEIEEDLKPAKTLFPSLFKESLKKQTKGQVIQSLIDGRKILFIFKTADSEELSQQLTVDDNIYKKVKQLGKLFDDHTRKVASENKKLQLTMESIKFHLSQS